MQTTEKKENVIYKDGEMGIQTTTYFDNDGIERCNYSGYLRGKDVDLTVEEYLLENPGFRVESWENVKNLIEALQDKHLIGQFTEISEEDYDEALECLPPQKWETVDGVNIFRMSEYTTGNITCHYTRYNGKHYSANRRTSTPYAQIASEIKGMVTL